MLGPTARVRDRWVPKLASRRSSYPPDRCFLIHFLIFLKNLVETYPSIKKPPCSYDT